MTSTCFACLLSKCAINHPDKPWQNFTKLEPKSRCDNELLEWRLALELRLPKSWYRLSLYSLPIAVNEIAICINAYLT